MPRSLSTRLAALSVISMIGPSLALAVDSPPFSVAMRVDATRSRGEWRPIWRFFGADEPNYATMPHGRKLVAELGALRPKHVYFRAHNLLTSGDGTPGLKWGSTGVREVRIRDAQTALRFRLPRQAVSLLVLEWGADVGTPEKPGDSDTADPIGNVLVGSADPAIIAAPEGDDGYYVFATGRGFLVEENIAYGRGPFLIGGSRPSRNIRARGNILHGVGMRPWTRASATGRPSAFPSRASSACSS